MDIKAEVLNNLEGISYVSFDIFDTLLLRMMRYPKLIFDKTYKMNPSLFPEYMDAREWREIRVVSENFARKDNLKREITLDDIYNRLPDIIKNRDEIKQNEIMCEINYSFINEEIAQLIYLLVEKYKKKIVLISDMYLSEEIIKKMLTENGFKMQYVEKLFVSSESGYQKNKGSLYDYVCKELLCLPEQILHIGDNRNSDYIKARQKGFNAIFYPFISEAVVRYPFIPIEEGQYGILCEDLYTLRIMAAQNDLQDDAKLWYELGAMILGPFVTYASEWVLDVAEKNNIHQIFPMMREGKFLGEALEQAKKHRNWNGNIISMYISRKALYPALLSVAKTKDIEYFFTTLKMSVRNFVELFDIEDDMQIFKKYYDYDFEALKKVFDGKESIYSKIKNQLCDTDIIEKIKEKNKNVDELFFKYLQQLGLDKESYITYDIGWRGNAANAISRIMQKHGSKTSGIHLLLNGMKAMVTEQNLDDSCDIRGFSGNFGKNDTSLADIVIEIFEIFFGCNEGTTVGYKEENGKIVPITKEIPFVSKQREMTKYVQLGMLNFQKKYYELLKAKKQLVNINVEELVNIIGRLLAYPTRKEAMYIGNMYFEQNFGIDERWQIISQEKLDLYKEIGFTKFFLQNKGRKYEWYQGMDAYLDGFQNYKRIMYPSRNRSTYKYCLFTEQISRLLGKFVLVGAGTYFKDIILFLNMVNETDKLEMVIDSNKFLIGQEICGQKVFRLDTKIESNCFVITPLDINVVNEISEELKKIHGDNIRIISLYQL